jgi:hydrogenase-4 component F
MLNHSLNKSLMFFGAGTMMRGYGSKEIAKITRVGQRFPVTGALWLAGAVAITGAPPFGLFQSELAILRAGFASPSLWAAVLMALLLIVIFTGFLNHFRVMYFEPPPETADDAPAQPQALNVSALCIAPMWLTLIPLLVFGLWWPEAFSDYFARVAHALSGGAQ